MENINKIYVGEKEFTASKYQTAIFNEIEHGVGNMVITAAAGSSKTTTIENCLRFIPGNKKCLFLAFNVSTVDKLKKEIRKINNTYIMTFHGLGNRILRENEIIKEDTIIDEFKYSRYIKQHIMELAEKETLENMGIKIVSYVANIIALTNYARYYMAMRVKDIENVAKIYGIVPVADDFEIVRKVLIWGKDNIKSIDHTDMIWLPNIMNLVTRRYLFDFIFIDEAQDTTLAHQQLVDKTFKRGCRFIAVGDPRQQINVWCGATEKAIENYENRNNTKKLSLPISYRCPKIIVEAAKQYAPEIEADANAINGDIRYDVSANDARPGDMVLCRIISKLIEQYLTYLRNNKKAYLKGSDGIKETYLDLISKVNAKKIDSRCLTTNGLIPQLYKLYFERLEEVKTRLNIDEEEAYYHYEILSLYDDIEALKVLSEGLTTVDELVDKIKVIFNGDKDDAIILSTVHKAKGMEADNIFILNPSLMPSRLANKKWEIKAEENLMYVAITRAKKSLNYIKEEERGFFKNFLNTSDMRDEIEHIKQKINYISKTRSTDAAEAPVIYKESKPEIIKNESSKKKKGLKFCELD